MNLKISKNTISTLTDGHKILGLAFSAVLYLICMTGTIVVFFVEMERWEQPTLPEYTAYDNSAIARAALDTQKIMVADKNRSPVEEDIYIGFPSDNLPRIVAGYSDDARAYDSKGNYVGSANHPNVHFVSELHYYLHLPESYGMIVVSVLGIFMLALLIGGALSHKKIFADAFKLRLRAEGHLGRADTHNRIGTWTLPFALVVTATGSFVGFSQLIVFLIATVFYQGDFSKVMDPMLGSQHEITKITQSVPLKGEAAIVRAISELKKNEPDAIPTYLVLKKAATYTPSLEIIAKKADRLAFGETYRFDADGNLKAQNGYLNGAIGKQIYASLFPLHFGNYGGLPIKIAYFIVGFALCFMINAGMEIWFTKSAAKAKPKPYLHAIWVSFVYSSISAIVIAMTSNFFDLKSDVIIYWGSLISLIIIGLVAFNTFEQNVLYLGRLMRAIFALSILLLVIAHFIKFKVVNFATMSVSVPLILIAVFILVPIFRSLINLKQKQILVEQDIQI